MAKIQTVLGNNIRRLRNKNCWSQIFLADRLNVSVSFISVVESGQRGVSLSLIENIASVFGVSVPYLFTDHESENPPSCSKFETEIFKEELKEGISNFIEDFFKKKKEKSPRYEV